MYQIGDRVRCLVDKPENSSDECVVTPEIVRTSEPSKFIMWGNRLPHIFTVDKQRSKLVFNATVV